jgi:hypothetical protein
MQNNKLYGLSRSGRDDIDEYHSYYLTVMNTRLPGMKPREINFFVGKALGKLIYQPDRDKLTTQYGDQIQNLLNKVSNEVRQQYIKTIQQKTHTSVKFH